MKPGTAFSVEKGENAKVYGTLLMGRIYRAESERENQWCNKFWSSFQHGIQVKIQI